jgi:hypothetical protein
VAWVRNKYEYDYDLTDDGSDLRGAWFAVTYLPESGHLSLHGHLPAEETGSGPRTGWLEVRLRTQPEVDRSLIRLQGDVVAPSVELLAEWRRYFEALH